MEKSMHVGIRLCNAYYQEYMNASQAVNASRLWRTCWHHLPLTVNAKLAASLSTENAENALSSVHLSAAAGTAKTSQRDVSGSHGKLATGKAQLLHTASGADDDNNDGDGASTDINLLPSDDSDVLRVPRHRGEHLREKIMTKSVQCQM